MKSASLSAVQTIGDQAFVLCASLVSVSLPTAPPSIGSDIFSYTSSDGSDGSDGTITVLVPASAVPVYTSAWGVDAETPAGGNAVIYGDGHKAVLITDAAQ
jgi:hypothetical protein